MRQKWEEWSKGRKVKKISVYTI